MLEAVEEFIMEELENRRISGLPNKHPYIASARRALQQITKARNTLAAAKKLKKAVAEVENWDSLHGYGADEDGYNRLAVMKAAAYQVKL